MGGRGGRGGIGVILAGLFLVAGCSVSDTTGATTRHPPIAADTAAIYYWTAQVDADSQLVVTRDLQEEAASRALPPCAQTPAVDPPCTGFAQETAAAMSAVVAMIGQSVEDAEVRVTDDQRWLQAFQAKLKKDRNPAETPANGSTTALHAASVPGPKGAYRVLVFGDSTALTLGLALGDWATESHDGLDIIDDGQFGCGIAEGSFIVSGGTRVDVPAACNPTAPRAQQWPAVLEGEIAHYRPAVVILLAGRWEVFDRADLQGRVTDITHRGYALYIEGQLERFVGIASRSGGHVVLMTAPYYGPSKDPRHQPLPEDNPIRVATYNRLVSAVAGANHGTTSKFDLNAIVSVNGRYTLEVGHQVVRAPDGIHFPFYRLFRATAPDPDTLAQVLQFSHWIGPRVMPSIERAAA
jgi:hypothetical protein